MAGPPATRGVARHPPHFRKERAMPTTNPVPVGLITGAALRAAP
ncbi:hypothetical protein [Arthrobacter sp. TMS1-12-1]